MEKIITADDLIIEYMISKMENGYEPEFTISEFSDFLKFFESQMKVEDSLEDKEQLLLRFLERENEKKWYQIDNITKDKLATPHLDFSGNIVKANYRLRSSDTHFSYERLTKKIKGMIASYVKTLPKRGIAINEMLDSKDLMTGNLITAGMLFYLWEDYVNALVESKKWPKQCSDIYEYLLDYDLATYIELPSIKAELLEFYQTVSSRIASLYEQDRKFRMSTYRGTLLAYSNYLRVIEGYRDLVGKSFSVPNCCSKKRSLEVDLREGTMIESHELPGVYVYEEDDPDYRTTKKRIDDPKVKVLVQKLNKGK